jgi:hypothetical protein
LKPDNFRIETDDEQNLYVAVQTQSCLTLMGPGGHSATTGAYLLNMTKL